MPTEITMPKLSDTMEEGTILRWLKHEGEYVEKGELLAEVETDKADMELEASASGTLAEIRVKEGQSAAVGAVLALLSEAAAPADGGGRSSAAPRPESDPPRRAAAQSATPKSAALSAPRQQAPLPPHPTPPGTPPTEAPAPPPVPPPAPGTKWTAQPLQPVPGGQQALPKLRLAVAKQMAAAKREVPHFYVTGEIDMSEAARLRAALATPGTIPERITFTHILIRALAVTLRKHPRVNASWSDGSITYHEDVHIGIAVAVADGLIAPVVRSCQRLSLRQIARAVAELVHQAQQGHVGGEGLTGATFTLSNMGMLDIEEFTAVITPPQAAVLAVGSIKERPVVRDGQLAVAKTMRVTLSVDHRVLNGVEAGRFLEDLKRTLENPLGLLLEGD